MLDNLIKLYLRSNIVPSQFQYFQTVVSRAVQDGTSQESNPQVNRKNSEEKVSKLYELILGSDSSFFFHILTFYSCYCNDYTPPPKKNPKSAAL